MFFFQKSFGDLMILLHETIDIKTLLTATVNVAPGLRFRGSVEFIRKNYLQLEII
jgi:hypothetical protein